LVITVIVYCEGLTVFVIIHIFCLQVNALCVEIVTYSSKVQL